MLPMPSSLHALISARFTGIIYTYGSAQRGPPGPDPHTHTEAEALRLPNGSGQRGTLTPAPRQLPRVRGRPTFTPPYSTYPYPYDAGRCAADSLAIGGSACVRWICY